MQFVLPEDLTALSADDLAAAEQEAMDEFDSLRQVGDDLTDEQVDDMEALAGHIGAMRAEEGRRATAQAERRARAEAAVAEVDTQPPAETEPDPDQPDEGDEGDEGDEEEETEEPQPGAPPESTVVPVPVAASVVRSSRRVPNPTPRRQSGLSITASADIPGVAAGSRLNGMPDIATAFINRSAAYPTFSQGGDSPYPGDPGGPAPGIYNRYGVATISRGKESFQGLTYDNPDFPTIESLLDEAARPGRLPKGSLTAAGGWCAPSETLYDLCPPLETLDNLYSLPEIRVNRGGIRYTTAVDFSDIYANQGFCFTEAEIIGGATKPCFTLDCPPFTEVRLDACGLCIKAPILTNAAWPELVNRWISGSLVAHQIQMANKTLAAVAAQLGTAVAADTGASGTSGTLAALELAALGLRYQWHASETTPLEVVAPLWLKSVIRADLSNRSGVDLMNVSDAQINSYFAARNLAVQWVFGWEDDAFTGANAGCQTNFPATADVLIYLAGTFVKGTADVISLDTVYDTTDLQQNIFTALFFEEGWLVAKRCGGGCRLTLPVCASGQTGAADRTDCLTAAVGP